MHQWLNTRVGAGSRFRPRRTRLQNLDLQRDALKRVGCEKIFEEKESGRAGTKRPAFEAALAYLRPEDQPGGLEGGQAGPFASRDARYGSHAPDPRYQAGATHEISQPEERACNHRSRRPACDA